MIVSNHFYRWGLVLLWMLLTSAVFTRAPIPIDETRYLTVAWEMWQRGDFLVPYLNGQTYSHKPPMLFWLMQLGWAIFGFNDYWPRLVGPLVALLDLFLVRQIALKLWPKQVELANQAPWILLASLLWTLFATSTMFDILLTAWVLIAMLGLLELQQGRAIKGWLLVALSVGFGLLAKGPVIFLHIVPTTLLMAVWARSDALPFIRLSFGLILAIILGVVLALVWALPAATAGGEEYAGAILWHQTADRAVSTNIHKRGLFWYLPFLPLFLFPWLFWGRVWCGFRQPEFLKDLGVRFCLVWLLSTIILFSVLPSKQIHYLIPMLPAFALLVARALNQTHLDVGVKSDMVLPILLAAIGVFLMFLPEIPRLNDFGWVQHVDIEWGLTVLTIAVFLALSLFYWRKFSVLAIATAMVVSIFAGLIFFFKYNRDSYDLTPAALEVKAFNEQGVDYAFVGNYQGQLQYLGRLTQALPVITSEQVSAWVEQHPQGYLISLEKQRPETAYRVQGHREYWLVFRSSSQFNELKPL